VSALPRAARAIMASRVEPPDSLDFFPTPPWVTRTLLREIIGRPRPGKVLSGWDPAAGEGHMSEVMRETFSRVHASDVHDYGRGYAVGSFVGDGIDVARPPWPVDWIITNPPYRLAAEFALRAIELARVGVALLCRLQWLESAARWTIWSRFPPSVVAVFLDRPEIVRGRWDPEQSPATGYAWFVWRKPIGTRSLLTWIPPGARKRHTLTTDRGRFGAVGSTATTDAPLFANKSEGTP